MGHTKTTTTQTANDKRVRIASNSYKPPARNRFGSKEKYCRYEKNQELWIHHRKKSATTT